MTFSKLDIERHVEIISARMRSCSSRGSPMGCLKRQNRRANTGPSYAKGRRYIGDPSLARRRDNVKASV